MFAVRCCLLTLPNLLNVLKHATVNANCSLEVTVSNTSFVAVLRYRFYYISTPLNYCVSELCNTLACDNTDDLTKIVSILTGVYIT